MDKRTKAKLAATIICLIVSFAAIYMFAFEIDASMKMKTVLVVVGLFWIVSGISNIISYFK